MITNFLAERKKMIFELGGGSDLVLIGRLIDCVIDPDSGKIRAWWVESFEGLRVLLPSDIVSWGKQKIVIHSEGDLSLPDALPKMKPFFEKELPIIEAPAFAAQKRIGRVKDFSFNTRFSQILSFFVKGLWWVSPSRIFPSKTVDKITREGVFFSSDTKKVMEEKLEKPKNVLPEVELE